MRTQQEILDKIEEVKSNDWMGTQLSVLVGCLEFKNAQQFLKEGVTEKEWNTDCYIEPTAKNIKDKMADYLDFAFEKAEGERGISAGRSMDYYSVWIWLINEEDRFGDVREYTSYGLPHLEAIKQYLAGEGAIK